jgi:hypothetical protein
MRYHKAIKISRPEAHFIIGTATSAHTDPVVIGHHTEWYDIRGLTAKEVDRFLEDLMRADIAHLQAGCITPH